MVNSALFGGVVGIAGALAYDKVFNESKVTDKLSSAVGSNSFSTSIREVVTGGTEIIKERIVENNIIKEVLVNPIENIKENVVDSFDNIKDKTSDVIDKVTPDLGGLNYSPISSTGGFWEGYSNFKDNGGIVGEASDIVGLGWLGSNLKGAYNGAIDGSQKFYSGVYNIGTIVKGAVTGQEYEARKVNGNFLNFPVETPKTSSSSSGYKSSSSSSGGSSKRRSSKKKSPFSRVITIKPKVSNFTPSRANFSSIDGSKKYVAPPKTKSKFIGPVRPKSSGYKKKNYSSRKRSFSSIFG